MIDFSQQKGIKETVLREAISSRYAQRFVEWLKENRINFKEQKKEHQQEQEMIQFQIQLQEPIISKQNQFYYNLMKNFYEVRKILNPELTFESFLSQYRNELTQKIQRYKLDSIDDPQTMSSSINTLIIANESTLMKTETIRLIREKKQEISTLEKKSEQVNLEYERLVQNLIQKNVELSVENIQYQLKLKQLEISKKEKTTKIYLPSQSMKNKVQIKQNKHYEYASSSVNNEKKQEVERIKVVVNNNMWGWGDKIHDRLKKLKSLQEELHK